MTLRQKTLITVGASLFISLLLYGISSVLLLRQVSRLEEDSAVRNVARARLALQHQVSELAATTADYASWDDTYAFIEDGNEDYIRSNMVDETFLNLGLDVMLFFDASGEVVFGKAMDLRGRRETEIPATLARALRPGALLLEQGDPAGAASGLLSLPEGPLMVAASPITTSQGKGPVRGTLVVGQWLSRRAIAEIETITDLSVAVCGLEARDLAREARSAAAALRVSRGAVARPLGSEVMAAYELVDDVYGKPALVLDVQTSRLMYGQVREAIGHLLAVVLAAGVFCGGMSLLLVDRVTLSRMARLNTTVERVKASGDLSLRAPAAGGDELSGLGRGINGMLSAMERSQRDMRKSEERYRAFVEQSSDAVWRLESEQPIPIQTPEEEQIALIYRYGYLAECNDVMAQMHGYKEAEDLAGTRFDDFLPVSDSGGIELVRAFIRGGYRATDVVSHHTGPEGDVRYYLNSAVGIVEDGALVRAWGVQKDITGRRRAEAKLRMQTSAINAASDQIIITDPQGAIEFVNPAFERETGLTLEEVAGERGAFPRMEGHDRGLWEEIQRTVGAGQTWQGEIACRRADGSPYTTDTTITPVSNEAGAIEHFVLIRRDVTEKKRYEEQLDHLAHHDALTGLPNRLLLSDRLTRRLAGSRMRRQPLAVMFLDLDRFKLINDTLGHTAGDRLLQTVAKRLTGGLREVDTIARTGGDEFTVIVSEIEGAADAAKVAERILSAFLRPFVVERQELFITASVGISLFPSDGTDVETLIKNADTAMYRAKEQGRNNFQFFTKELSAAALSRMRMEHRLRRAVEGSEFVLHYQPRVDIGMEAVLGAEALLRWQQPELGLVQPLEFIGLAEETGLIIPITEWVLRTACGQNKAWQDEGIPAMTVDVNIAARQLQQHDLPAVIQEALDVTGLAPEHLGLEMTESALMGNPEVAVRVLRKLKDMGIGLFIDDFGTGHSSLSHLKQFPVDGVKIDRSFVKNVTTNPDDAAIASAIVAMAHGLKLRVIAEGVETEAQLAFLRGLGCDEVQGYLVRRPVPAEEFGRHLRSPLKELAAR